jgi:hypothetical protein
MNGGNAPALPGPLRGGRGGGKNGGGILDTRKPIIYDKATYIHFSDGCRTLLVSRRQTLRHRNLVVITIFMFICLARGRIIGHGDIIIGIYFRTSDIAYTVWKFSSMPFS